MDGPLDQHRLLKEGAFLRPLHGDIQRMSRGLARTNHLAQPLVLVAQEDAYSYAQRLYPRSAETMKKPPYLIWPGPGPTGNADV